MSRAPYSPVDHDSAGTVRPHDRSMTRALIRAALSTTLAASLLMGGTAWAANQYFASLAGTDSTCEAAKNKATPARTIAFGVSCLVPGDTLYLREGTWTEIAFLANNSGAPGLPKTLAGYPGERVVMAPFTNPPTTAFAIEGTNGTSMSYWIFRHLIFDGVNAPRNSYSNPGGLYHLGGTISVARNAGLQIKGGSHDLTFDDVEITRWNFLGAYIGSTATDSPANITFRNCNIHDQELVDIPSYRYEGFYIHNATNMLIENCDLHDNGGGGFQAYTGPNPGLVIRNNRIHDNNRLKTQYIGGGIFYSATQTGALFYNNLVYNNGSDPNSNAASDGICIGNGSSGNKLWNNTFYGNKGAGISLEASVNNNDIRNNISFGNHGGDIVNLSGSTTYSNNLCAAVAGLCTLAGNPSFVNPGTADFHLQPGSPAAGEGITLSSSFTTDFDGITRTVPWDIGALAAPGSQTAPAAPTGLVVR